ALVHELGAERAALLRGAHVATDAGVAGRELRAVEERAGRPAARARAGELARRDPVAFVRSPAGVEAAGDRVVAAAPAHRDESAPMSTGPAAAISLPAASTGAGPTAPSSFAPMGNAGESD